MTTLSDRHCRELYIESGIDPDVVAERGYTTTDPSNGEVARVREVLRSLHIVSRAIEDPRGLVIPIWSPINPTAPLAAQFKPLIPIPDTKPGKERRYFNPYGTSAKLDVHPRNHVAVKDPAVELWVTEGVKKADSLTSRGLCAIALFGVWNWRNKAGPLGDWEYVPRRDRTIFVCFDTDTLEKPSVLDAMKRFGRWLTSCGATVRYVVIPNEVEGIGVKGVDDYLAAGGDLELLRSHATAGPPSALIDDTFTDARLAETIAEGALVGSYCWCAGLGWLTWTGQRWKLTDDVTVTETVRRYVLECFSDAVEAIKRGDTDAVTAVGGWQQMLEGARLRRVLGLTKGIVQVMAEEFDADPDLLNTPSGVVDLRSGRVVDHDPDLMMTKTTSGSYVPGYAHPDWDTALTALPDDVREWFRIRIGQGITGHTTPDGVMPVLQGSGENGKSAFIIDGLIPALGDYASPTSSKLFMSTKGSEHSTEMVDLMGQRLMIAEEVSEDRAIDVTALKRIQDVGIIKARRIRENNISFSTSHSLFVTTNPMPVINETDWGTWRRLALVKFPYTYTKPGQPLTTPNHRIGDAQLKQRIKHNVSGQHDAIVTWAVEGSIAYYADETGVAFVLPATVVADTTGWRSRADRILGYWRDQLIPDRDACVITTELREDFNYWLKRNGHNEWSKETFGPRFLNHTETSGHGVEERRMLNPKGLVRRSGIPTNVTSSQLVVYRGVRFRNASDLQ